MSHFKFAITAIAIFCSALAIGQLDVKVYGEEQNGGYKMFVDNDEVCEVSIVVSYTLKNMKSANPEKKPVVVPPNSKRYEIDQITIIDPKKASKFTSQSQIFLGDVTLLSFDRDFKYSLPFKKGEAYKVDQGYNGSFSHKNENALDFTMKVGTEILAIRDGIVVKVVSKHALGCKDETCKKYNNYVMIRHSDGTFSEYAHIKKNGNKVNVGDIVKQGDIIALSGNTGWSTNPHLHLVVFQSTLTGRQTLPTVFLTGDGSISEVLAEKNIYTRNY